MQETEFSATDGAINEKFVEPSSANGGYSDVYHDPLKTLAVLRDHFDSLDSNHDGSLTKLELTDYTARGSDSEAQGAAKMALNHVNELGNMASRLPDFALTFGATTEKAKPEQFSKYDLDVAIASQKNNWAPYMARMEGSSLMLGSLLGVAAASATMPLVWAWSTPATWPLAAPGTAMIGAVWAVVGKEFYNMAANPKELVTQFHKNKETIDSWSEFRRQKV